MSSLSDNESSDAYPRRSALLPSAWQGRNHNVTVPPGCLQDIVKPYWRERVEFVAHRPQNRLELLDINPAEASQ